MNNNPKRAIKNRSFSTTLDYIHVPLHEQSGANIQVNGQHNGVDISSIVTLSGSPSDTIWTNKPLWCEPESTTTGVLPTAFREMLLPDQYVAMLFLTNVNFNAGRVQDNSEHRILSIGSPGGVGGLQFGLYNGANLNFKVYIRDTSAGVTSKSRNLNANVGIRSLCSCFFDLVDRDNCWLNATDKLTSAVSFSLPAGQMFNDYGSNLGATLFARQTGAGAFTENLNTANLTSQVHDIWMIGFKTHPTDADLQSILTDISNRAYEGIESL